METITRINGNGEPYTMGLPTLLIRGIFNDTAIAHIKENTGLEFKIVGNGMEAIPETSAQIAALFLTYNFKTRYYNNWTYKNTLVLKSDHHVGFDVDSICYNCCKENHIVTTSLLPHERLSC